MKRAIQRQTMVRHHRPCADEFLEAPIAGTYGPFKGEAS